MSVGRRQGGSLRQLPSGRIQVRYTGPDGRRRTAPQTFPNRTLARRWLAMTEADMVRGQWRDPSATTDTLGAYALRWVVERELSDRTRELYFGLLERQVLPSLGKVELALITRHASGRGGKICWTPVPDQARWPRPTACSVP